VALGADEAHAPASFARALAALEDEATRVVVAARCVTGPFVGPDGAPDGARPAVVNTVARVETRLGPADLLERLLAIERSLGRVRGAGAARTIDLDLLAHGDARITSPGLEVPHPRAWTRAFVLAPWEEIAPEHRIALRPNAPALPVVSHAAALRRADPGAFARLVPSAAPEMPVRRTEVARLPDSAALRAWRAPVQGTVGFLPTLGALHEGHAALLRRAAAECDRAIASIFVNPLQFGAGEDFARYPRTIEKDLELLSSAGACAAYLPAPSDLYPEGFAFSVVPSGFDRYEGRVRPGHFAGVATVVAKLLLRVRPDRVYFGQKDAQQLALVRRLVRDLDLPGRVVPCATVRDADGLALSSRNRYLDDDWRSRARALPRELERAAQEAADGEHDCEALCERARSALAESGLGVDYLEVVDPDSFAPIERLASPALAIAAVRAGSTRLLDNRWIAPAPGEDA
jgi:pantoate--beta-alanine ligase